MNKMKWRAKSSKNTIAALLAVVLASGLPVVAAPVAQPSAAQLAPRSIFILPANPKEGCDPFFPASLRPYESAVPSGAHGDLTELRLNGVSGPPNHRLVIINNVTFGAGDDAEVRTSQGRVRIHCLKITGTSVMIEANGQPQELRYGDKP